MKPMKMVRVVEGKKYSTEKAEIIAHDAYWDGHNFERHGRNTYLYKTPKGNYFCTHLTQWQGDVDTLEPLSIEEAIAMFDELEEKEVEFEEAFPNAPVEEA